MVLYDIRVNIHSIERRRRHVTSSSSTVRYTQNTLCYIGHLYLCRGRCGVWIWPKSWRIKGDTGFRSLPGHLKIAYVCVKEYLLEILKIWRRTSNRPWPKFTRVDLDIVWQDICDIVVKPHENRQFLGLPFRERERPHRKFKTFLWPTSWSSGSTAFELRNNLSKPHRHEQRYFSK